MPLARDRTLPLLAFLLVLGGVGVAQSVIAPDGEAPAPCAAPAREGDRLRCDGVGVAPGARVYLAGGRLDLNAATVKELESLPKVGPRTAEAIAQDREANGPFPTLEALTRVKGIGPKTLERLRPWLTVGEPGDRSARQSSAGPSPVSGARSAPAAPP